MTEILYMPDIESNYIREFGAKVVRQGEGHVVLDRTAFYPAGGGQETDTGVLHWSGGIARVHEVLKKEEIMHFTKDPLPSGDVKGVLDWERRFLHMRMHTSQHIVSGVVFDSYKARTVGNQIHADRSRVDFAPIELTEEDAKKIERKCNEILASKAAVKIYEEERAELEKRIDAQRANLDLLPKSVSRLRIVDIGGFDVCPCAGTHVRNTGEIGRIEIIDRERKGKDRFRITYKLNA
ncbi:MAG: alanyl-tRNA editing protein [Euryarchaeota archaeon]|nr:alanyl-tRNA editing protein [Euryarchaeota archaeon]